MPLSLKEITQREKALRQEIQEREHLLRAYASMRADRSEPPVEEKTDSPLDSADDEASSAAPPAPQLDPELAHLRFGGYGSRRLVAWAIRHMKDDFDLHDIADLLARCDCHITNPQISVVLSRMNQDGKLELIRPGSGRAGAVYRPREGIHLWNRRRFRRSRGKASGFTPFTPDGCKKQGKTPQIALATTKGDGKRPFQRSRQ